MQVMTSLEKHKNIQDVFISFELKINIEVFFLDNFIFLIFTSLIQTYHAQTLKKWNINK